MPDLKPRFVAFWETEGLKGDPSPIYDEWENAHSTPDRYHHRKKHLGEGHELLDDPKFRAQCDDPIDVEAAWWWHDFVNKAGRTMEDNEGRSATKATEVYCNAGMDENRVYGIIRPLILATRHSLQVGLTPNVRVIRDMDLWVLGQPRERYAQYATEIRQEWVGSKVVTSEEYRLGRIAFLGTLLKKRRHIFYTPLFREQYGQQAVDNLTWESSMLKSGTLL